MPGSYTILPAHGIVCVEYHGTATLADATSLMRQYVADPARMPGQRQLIDLSRIDDWEKDFVGLMQYQAQAVADVFAPHDGMMMVIFANTPPGVSLGQTFVQTWSAVDGALVSLQTTEAEALSVLGQTESQISELLDTGPADARVRRVTSSGDVGA